MPPIFLLTAYDDPFSSIGRIAEAAWGEYARRHGYVFYVDKNPVATALGRHPSWARIPLLQRAVAAGYLGVWVDADSVPAPDAHPIDELLAAFPIPHILTGRDNNGPCCAHIFARPTRESEGWLRTWWHLGPTPHHLRYHPEPKWEQDTFKVILEFFPELAAQTGMLSSGQVCQDGPPLPGAWALHASGPLGTLAFRCQRLLHAGRPQASTPTPQSP